MEQNLAVVRPRAVQYVRMSTEHQCYSIENQIASIAKYAKAEGYSVVATYADEGKSGLTLRERKALKRLLHDVCQPERNFEIILVLDVTRWGRFQDPDQSAAYEFFCREAGVRVEYAAEAFANDGSVATTIVKHLKRIMAAEYSRELSEKVLQAQIQQAHLGFRQGGADNYGVRRMVVDACGNERGILLPGEQKFLRSDKIRFKQGPEHEIATIRRIFDLFVKKQQYLGEIARRLNSEAIADVLGQQWSARSVTRVLRNELMIGVYVFNRTSVRLKAVRRENFEADWVRVKVFEPIVSPKLFALAAKRLDADLSNFVSDGEILEGVRRLLQERGKVDWALINACGYLPHASTVCGRFGGLRNVFNLIGYDGKARRSTGLVKWHVTDEDLMDGLRRLHAQFGRVSATLINSDDRLPCSTHFVRKFGSLLEAYRLAGLPYSRRQLHSSAGKDRWRRNLMNQAWPAPDRGASVE